MVNNKPKSMLARDYIMRRMSHKMNIPAPIIEAVVKHSFDLIHEKMPKYNTLEVSGFGKFIFNTGKAQKRLTKELSKKKVFEDRLNNPDVSDVRKISYQNKLNQTLEIIKYIKPKLNVEGTVTVDNEGTS